MYIINKEDDGNYKMLWLLIIALSPLLGVILYLSFGNKHSGKSILTKLNQVTDSAILGSSSVEKIKNQRVKQTLLYIERISNFKVKENVGGTFYPLGEIFFSALLKELRSAEKYIYMNYFIIENGEMWESIVDILVKKAQKGVDVRIIYDDFGSLKTFSKIDAEGLIKGGIKITAFNPLKTLNASLNYRDHKKITIIDGRVAFSGGINISDKYINRVNVYGHWKDVGFSVYGQGVINFLKMFIDFWNSISNEKISSEFSKPIKLESKCENKSDGFVLSYCDFPVKKENVSNEAYVEILSQAVKTAYFYTPYLMPSDTLLTELKRTAKRGVDVKIIMPAIPDKKFIFKMSKSFYLPLLKSGVKIYEYTPGFVHAKACVVDGVLGSVGTVNLDYRSLFLHFENNSLFYNSTILTDIEKDFLKTLKQCKQIKLGVDVKTNFLSCFFNGLLRVFAPFC